MFVIVVIVVAVFPVDDDDVAFLVNIITMSATMECRSKTPINDPPH